MFEEQEKKEIKSKSKKGMKSIVALRDHKFAFNGAVYDLQKGESYEMPEMFLANLKTEKVIK